MHIWVDADACPVVVRQILFRAAERAAVGLTLVANQPVKVPASKHVRAIQVASGFDVADGRIAEEMAAGDLVVTADIPLAAEVVARGGLALSPRGELFTEENVRERLATRNLMDELRGAGMVTGGPAAYGQKERQAFANALDRLIARRGRE